MAVATYLVAISLPVGRNHHQSTQQPLSFFSPSSTTPPHHPSKPPLLNLLRPLIPSSAQPDRRRPIPQHPTRNHHRPPSTSPSTRPPLFFTPTRNHLHQAADPSSSQAQPAEHHHHHRLDYPLPAGHACSGHTCSYTQIGDVFLCEKTGRVHVCDEDDTCREAVLDQSTGLMVCPISGHCFDRWLTPEEEESAAEQQQAEAGVTDEAAEPFMGSGRFARAYLLGYNCADEKELEATLRFC